jgi:hypothetical protein
LAAALLIRIDVTEQGYEMQEMIAPRERTNFVGRGPKGLQMLSMEAKLIAAVSTIAAVTAVGAAPNAHADTLYHFQSPSGNITCVMSALQGVTPQAACGIGDHTWVAPPRPQVCMGGWGDQIDLDQGSPPALVCHSDTTRGGGLPPLQFGDRRSVASLTCESEPAGIMCTDSTTGHFFRISRDSYDLK